MKIAIVGHRGIPANFGGSETAVEEIGERLVQAGHEVIVYCRRHNSTTDAKMYKGMERVVLPSINTLSLDMPSHTFLSIWHLILRKKVDIIHFHGVGNALFFPMLKLFSRNKTLLVVDGPDWDRPKWGRLARLALKTSFPLAVRFADTIISDNRPVQRLFREEFGRETDYVVYGANTKSIDTTIELEKHGLEPDNYMIQVAAIVPDKGVHLLVEAYEQLETDMPLVIVGDTPYTTEYKAKVMSTKDKRIKFLGYIYGERYRELVAHAYAYVHPLIVDGTSPALLQAMALGKCIISTDLPETMGVIQDVALPFKSQDVADLRDKLQYALDHPDDVANYGRLALQRINERYNWDVVTRQYEALSFRTLGLPYDEAILDAESGEVAP
ncbi:MAG: glycosyltransferase [Anaerolineae bacterium]|nr:glycosyltransferase [Anaerolineae bacterium]